MKHFTQKDYDNFMKVVNRNIKETERRLETLDKTKKVSELSFEDWVKYQNGELKIKQSGGEMVDATSKSNDDLNGSTNEELLVGITGSNPVLITKITTIKR